MTPWTVERYRELARRCRGQARHMAPPGAEAVLRMADEYDARADAMEPRS